MMSVETYNSKNMALTLLMGALPFLVVVALVYGLLAHYDTNQFQYSNFYDHSAIVGGFLSGSLHALTGADHMTALVPLIAGKRWWVGGTVGVVWGSGHGVTSACIGLGSYLMKNKLVNFDHSFESYRFLIDLIIGATLVVIGGMGIYELHHEGKDEETQTSAGALAVVDSEGAAEGHVDVEAGDRVMVAHKSSSSSARKTAATLLAVFINGSVLGVSWDGLPSLAPTMVLEMWSLLVSFLAAYCLGTVLTMGFAAALVGEATCWLSKISGTSINIADRLAYLSSCAAAAIGLCWLGSALMKFNDGQINTNDNFNWSSSPQMSSFLHFFLTIGSVVSVVVVILWGMYTEFAPQVENGGQPVTAAGGSSILQVLMRSAANKVTFSMAGLSLADDKLLVHTV